MKKIHMTSEESFEVLKRIEEEFHSMRFSRWEEREEYEKKRREAIKNLVPRVGLGCTICFYSDRRAATVTKVISPRKVEVAFNKVVCKDYYAAKYEILPECDSSEHGIVFTKRRNGSWIEEEQETKGGLQLMLHYQNHYIDPSF